MIRIVLDQNTLRQSKSGSVTAVIYFDFGFGRQFPSADWDDFVVVIISWWMAALNELMHGSDEVCLHFMDGPYEIRASVQGANVVLCCVRQRVDAEESYEVIVGLEELRRELMTAAGKLSSACSRANIQAPELSEIRKHMPN